MKAVHLVPEIGPGLFHLRNNSPVNQRNKLPSFMGHAWNKPHIDDTSSPVVLIVTEKNGTVSAGFFPDNYRKTGIGHARDSD